MSTSNYDKFPFVAVPDTAEACSSGWENIATRLQSAIKGRMSKKPILVVECYPGVDELAVLNELKSRLSPALTIHAAEAMLPAAKIDALVAPFLGGDDLVFGYLSGLSLVQFFDAEPLWRLRREIEELNKGLILIVGCGASLIAWGNILVYADLARWEVAAARLVGRVSEAMSTPDAVDPDTPLYFGAAYDGGAGPPDLAPSRRYQRAISVDQPVVQLAPGVTASGDVLRSAQRVAGLRRQLQNALLATAPDATLTLSDDASRALLLGDGVPALRAFVTLANGVHVSYPGYGGYEPGYDGRARKKYTSTLAATTGATRVHWGELYADRHGRGPVLPLGCVLIDRGDRVAGVAGLELSLTWIAEHRLVLPDAPWADEQLLLDAQGRILVRVPAGGAPVFPGASEAGEAGELRLVAFTHDQARRAAVAAEAGVLELPDGRIAAVSPLSTIAFTLVVIADPRRLGTP